MVDAYIKGLVAYALEKGLIEPADGVFCLNALLSILKLDSLSDDVPPADAPLEEILGALCDDAVKRDVIEDSITYRDLFDTALMGALTPRPSQVISKFRALYAEDPVAATDDYYRFSCDTNYIRRDRIKKELLPVRETGATPICHHAPNAKEEARWIATRIADLTADGMKPSDIAVLYRAHYVTRALEDALIDAKIPYVIYSGTPFFARREIKDALSYLRMTVYKDDLSFRRVANLPKRNLGQRRMAFLEEIAEKENCTMYQALQKNLDNEIFKRTKAKEFVEMVETFAQRADEPATELLAAILDVSGYERLLRTEGSQERLDNLAELKAAVREYEETCGEEASAADFLNHAALFTNSDAETHQDRIRLMTIHTAKGLEFPVVFLMAMNEGILPSRKTKTREAMEEERRLAFVAMTRAKDRLYLSETEGLHNDGAVRFPSRFLLDVDKALLVFDPEPSKAFVEEARAEIAAKEARLEGHAAEELSPGQRVRHAAFGDGTVLSIETDAVKVQFDTIKTPRALAAGKLEKMSR